MGKGAVCLILAVALGGVVLWALRTRRSDSTPRETISKSSVVATRQGASLMIERSTRASGRTEKAFGARIARLLNDESEQQAFRLNGAELAEYLERNGTNATGLLTAFEASRDPQFIRRAGEAFPDDPFVQSKVLAHDVFPEARGEWIARFKASAPDNSYPHLLAAEELMKKGDSNGALVEIVAGRGKQYNDYTRETMAGLEEAYVLAGRPVAESKAFGSADVLLPQLAPFKKLGMDLRDAANRAAQEGDSTAQTGLLEGTWLLGAQLRQGGDHGVLLDELVGLAIQNISLGSWPEKAGAPFLEGPVSEEQAQNAEFRKQVRIKAAVWDGWQAQASENEVVAYYDRLRTFGERNAMEWLMRLHPEFIPEGTLVSGK